MLTYFKTILLGTTLFIFLACDSSNYELMEDDSLIDTISGVVVDGYISNATVCLDINNNSICDSDELTTQSDQNGSFTFNNLKLTKDSLITILSSGGIDTATNENFNAQLKKIVPLKNQIENNLTITPLTDLIAVSFLKSDNYNQLALDDAKTKIADSLGISKTKLDIDPMSDISLFTKVQEIQSVKFAIETLINKNIDILTKDKENDVRELIKKEIIMQNYNLERILVALEIDLETPLPENQKTFVLDQISTIKTKLDKLALDSFTKIKDLGSFQKSLNTIQIDAKKQLLSADNNSSIKILDANISTKATVATTTIFDKTDAELDEQACISNSKYNFLTNTSFLVNYSNDTVNGISLKSKTETVKIFYSNLDVSKSTDNIVILQNDYTFVYNSAWMQNNNKTIYVMTQKTKNSLYSCYRFELNSLDPNKITPIKVYRYNEL